MNSADLDKILADLHPDDRAVIIDHAERTRLAADPLASPAAFGAAFSAELGTPWLPYRHLRFISDAMVAGLEHDEWDLLILTAHPRSGKTELCSRWTPAWAVIKHDYRVGLATYEADFSATHGRKTREIVTTVGPRYGVEVKADSKAAARWDILGKQGGMWTAGAGGPITGKGGQLLIVDDPIKNSDDARSAVKREQVWEWWQSTFLTRREPGGKVIVMMTRWHHDDLVGRLLKEQNRHLRMRVINLPALAEEDDALGRLPGEALVPERFDEKALAAIRESVGAKVWAALYQQRPQLDGGGLFKRATFRYWRWADPEVALRDRILVLESPNTDEAPHLVRYDDLRVFATFDPAYTRGKKSDFTAAGVWGITPHDPSLMVLLEGHRVRVQHVDHVPMIEGIVRRWNPTYVGVEKINATLGLLTDLQRRGLVVKSMNPDRSKEARAEAAAPLFEAGRVYHPKEGGDWLDHWEDELLTFPVGAHDDCVDVTAYACREMIEGIRGRWRQREPESEVASHVHKFLKQQARHKRKAASGFSPLLYPTGR